jgi:Flp pilus assembly protein TadD
LKTADQIKVWKNSETLWSHIAEKADYVPDLAFFSLGKIMEQKGDHAQAIRHYETAVELNPGDMRFLGRLAAALAAKGDHARAREKLEIVRRNALSADICVSVGRTYLILGDFDEADRMFRKALEMDPRNGAALTMMIADRLKRGDTEGARALHAEGIAKGIPLTLNLNAVMSAVEAQSHVE